MRALFCACACLAGAAAAGGCGGGGDSSSSAKTTAQTTVVARPGVNRSLAKDLGKADRGQLARARGYTSCLVKQVKETPLTFRKGTGQSPPVIMGAIRGTKFGINLGSSAADAKSIEGKLRRGGNSALYTRGSTVIGFAGSKPTVADITILTNCADTVR